MADANFVNRDISFRNHHAENDDDDGISKATPLHSNYSLNFQFLKEGTLFDRSQQIDTLMEVLSRRLRPDSTPEFVLIAGTTGTGKTVLARKLKQPVQDRDGFFVMGKFDQLKNSQPFAPLVAAMTDFVRQVLKKSNEAVDAISADIVSQVGNDIGVLTVLVPALEELVGRPAEGSLFTLKSADAEERLKKIFVKFVKATCSLTRPLVLVMDDLQWADPGSLELLEAIVSDKHNQGLVVLGICRSNEVSYTHDLSVILRRLKNEKGVLITTVDVKCLSIQAANSLVACVLRSREDDCVGVTNIVYARTKGNVFFIVQFLKALFEDGVLTRDPTNHSWLWDDDIWGAKFENANSILDLTASRIKKLPVDCQLLLLYAACLGTELDEDLLSKLFVDSLTVGAEEKSVLYDLAESVSNVDLDGAIERCASEGVIIKESHSMTYRFLHDQVKEAAYNLIAPSEHPSLHISLGRFLCKVLTRDELEQYVFVVLDQMRLGIECIFAESEKVHFASLCLLAGKKAIISSDFKTSLRVLELGLGLLDARQCWRDEYELTLALHNTIAQVTCCLGDFQGTDEAVKAVTLHARSYNDQLPTLMLQVYTYGTRMRLKDSIELGLDVLEKLGEPIPRNPGTHQIIFELFKIKRTLKRRSDTSIIGLPDMTDQTKLSAMGILNLLIAPSFIARQNLLPLVTFKLFRLTLSHGASAVSTVACSGTGLVLANIGDHDTAYRLGQLALLFIGRYNAVRNDWIPRVYVGHYGIISLAKEPIGQVLEKLAHAHQVGLECGDVEMGFICLHMCRVYSFHAGYSLVDLEPKMKLALEQMDAKNQTLWYEMTHVCYEALLVLMGRTGDPAVTNGCLMTLEIGSEKLTQVLQTANLEVHMFMCLANIHRMVTAYYSGDFELALEMAKRSRNAKRILGTSMYVPFQVCYDALTCMALLRRQHVTSPIRKRRLLHQTQNCLAYFKKTAAGIPENYLHKIHLIEGELLAHHRKPAQAVSMYAKAQEQARKHGFLEVVAIACEQEAIVRREFGMAEHWECYQKAIRCYEEWGAFAKASRMKQLADENL
ncbi:unnamed protein product [Cylindrotheca closterium]|uniref:Orc1-like AAA ATPase domain-containing protein n=1 Tax=Cylindrotheca closterium TaxID=2856 RepID=A0AAD2G5S5_9STRA|nr:unnamed protein product [Cylindrotheca closterium]